MTDQPTREERPDPGALLGEALALLEADYETIGLRFSPAHAEADRLLVETLRALPDLLLGVSELAQRYGVQPNTVAVWTQRHQDFPQPLIQVGGRVRVWWAPDVDKWYNQRQR